MDEETVNAYAPLVLAYLGDAVYELEIRTMLVTHTHLTPNALNKRATHLVCAHAQSLMMESILPLLSLREETIYKRGRNANSATMAKHATVADYRRATGFEALVGYLYLTEQKSRMRELIKAGLKSGKEET